MKYQEINQEQQNKISKLSKDCGLFWAFSNKQFEESKTALKPGEKYVSIGAGGYLPKSQMDNFIKGMDEIEAWKKEAVKQTKAEEVILYELNNYESFYTGEIERALDVLEPLGYTPEQVKTVYHANKHLAEV